MWGLTALPWQAEGHSCTARFQVYDLGRRAGKTRFGGREAILQCAVPESVVWVVAPEMNLGNKEFREVWDLAVRKKLLPITGKSWREKWIDFENGSRIEVRTEENPDQLIGEGVDLMIVAEAARLKPTTWEELLRPTLADKPGRAIFTSTPRGRNFFHRLWLFGQNAEAAQSAEEDPRDWRSWQLPSSVNPFILGSEIDRIDRLIAQDPISHALLRQEWRAEFVSYQGIVFVEFSNDIHVRREPYEVGQKTYIAVDPGYTNPYSCLLVQVTGDETIRVLSEIYRTGKTTDEIITEAEQKWPFAMFDAGQPGNGPNPELEVVVDEAAADHIASWRLKGYNAYGKKPPLRTGIEVHHRLLRDPFRHEPVTLTNPLGIWPRLTVDPSCAHTIEEHNLYHYPDEERRRSDISASEVPVDADNHSISALRYLEYAIWPELFNERHQELEVVSFSDEELAAMDYGMARMQIEDGSAPHVDWERDTSLGQY